MPTDSISSFAGNLVLFLVLAKIEAGHVALSMETCEANSLLRGLADFAKPLAEKRRQVLVFKPMTEAAYVSVDLTRFNQIMVNFLSNAAKYSREEDLIEVGCVLTADGMVEFYVADSGYGIPLAQQDKVFETFNRLGREASTIEGTGIGLATARRLAEFMHGEIGFTSVADQGSRFWVRFRSVAAAPPLELPSAIEPQSGPALQAAKILYIEDNPANVLLVSRILATLPQTVLLTAENGVNGIALALAERPDLVLLDIHLPDMDGFEVLRRLRSDPAFGATPVIALTADADRRSLERGNAAGFNDYLTKPIQIDKFLVTLWQVLAARR